jgi:hypothetical protein
MAARERAGGFVDPGLPRLAFRLVWCAALAAALLSIAGGVYDGLRAYREVTGPFAEFGLRLTTGGAEGAKLGPPYARGGGLADIRQGDRIVAVDGQPSPEGWRAERTVARQLRAADGPSVRITARSTDGALRDHVLTRSAAGRAPAMARGLALEDLVVLFAAQLLQVAAAVLLFLRRAREPVPALFSLSLLLIVGGSANLWIGLEAPALQPFVSLMLPLGWCGLLLSVLLFPSGRLEPRWTRWVLIPIGVWTVASWVLDAGVAIYPQAYLDLSGVALFAVAVVAQIQRYRPLPIGPQRQQVRWAMFGFGAAAFAYALDLLLVTWRAQSDDPTVVTWLTRVHPVLVLVGYGLLLGGLVVSLLRFRLYDAEMVISRSAGYAVMTLTLAATWAGAQQAIQVIFEDSFGQQQALSAGLAAALAAMLVTPIHQRAMRLAERIFQKALTDLRLRLPAMIGDLRETASADDLLATSLERIHAGVRSSRGAVLLPGRRGWKTAAAHGTTPAAVAAWLRDDPLAAAHPTIQRHDPVFPLRLPLEIREGGRVETIGWLLLGPRPDGSFFQRDELETLRELADPIARSVRIAVVRTQRDQALRSELEGLKAELKTLRALVERQGSGYAPDEVFSAPRAP